MNQNDTNKLEMLYEVETKLNGIIKQEVEGIITRSRAQWAEEGERSTKYFFGLEKVNGKKKTIVLNETLQWLEQNQFIEPIELNQLNDLLI